MKNEGTQNEIDKYIEKQPEEVQRALQEVRSYVRAFFLQQGVSHILLPRPFPRGSYQVHDIYAVPAPRPDHNPGLLLPFLNN